VEKQGEEAMAGGLKVGVESEEKPGPGAMGLVERKSPGKKKRVRTHMHQKKRKQPEERKTKAIKSKGD
jgi:hypothetical protein